MERQPERSLFEEDKARIVLPPRVDCGAGKVLEVLLLEIARERWQ